MRRFFVRTFAGLAITCFVSAVLWANILYRDTSSTMSESFGQVYKGSASLAAERIEQTPRDSRARANVLAELTNRFGFAVTVLAWNEPGIADEARRELDAGATFVAWFALPEGSFVAVPLQRDVELLRLGPLPGSRGQGYARIALALTGVAGIFALGALLQWRPVARQFRALEEAAERARLGDLDVRVDMKSAPLRPIAQAFNTMADHLQRMIEAQRELLRAVSHEIRTPLARLRFAVERLAETDAPEQREQQMQGIDGDLQELDDLVGELLTLMRLEHGAGALCKEPISLPTLLDDLAAEIERDGLSIERSDLAEATGFSGDARLLRRALGNVLRNAARHARARVRVSVSPLPETVRIRVEDDGDGVPPADRGRIFEPFVRLVAGETGTGLGLSIVRRVVEAHGGRAWVEQADLGGCAVVLELPRSMQQRG